MDYPSVDLKPSPAYFIVNVLDILHVLFQPSVGLDPIPMVIYHPHP